MVPFATAPLCRPDPILITHTHTHTHTHTLYAGKQHTHVLTIQSPFMELWLGAPVRRASAWQYIHIYITYPRRGIWAWCASPQQTEQHPRPHHHHPPTPTHIRTRHHAGEVCGRGARLHSKQNIDTVALLNGDFFVVENAERGELLDGCRSVELLASWRMCVCVCMYI